MSGPAFDTSFATNIATVEVKIKNSEDLVVSFKRNWEEINNVLLKFTNTSGEEAIHPILGARIVDDGNSIIEWINTSVSYLDVLDDEE